MKRILLQLYIQFDFTGDEGKGQLQQYKQDCAKLIL